MRLCRSVPPRARAVRQRRARLPRRRQQFRRQRAAVGQHHGPLHVVLQLAHVARPIVLLQDLGHRWRQLRRIAAMLLAVPFQEEPRQRRDVLAPLAQRRQLDGHHVEAVIQVVAEAAGRDLVFEILIGGGDDTGIDADGTALADALEFLLLQDAQQLDLQLRAHAGDFVEEDGAAVRRLETAGLVVDGAGEGALDVAEQLALQQALGQGTAVDADVRPLGARAETVDGASEHLLAGAGLADQQHAGRRRGHQLGQPVHFPHGGGVSDDPRPRVVPFRVRRSPSASCVPPCLPRGFSTDCGPTGEGLAPRRQQAPPGGRPTDAARPAAGCPSP